MNRLGFFYFVALMLGICLVPGHGLAETPKPTSLGMVTGPASGTYIRFGQDIAKAAATEGLTINVKESNGSIENAKRIANEDQTSIGIVQSDLLGFLKRSKDPAAEKLTERMRMLYPFYPEEVHLLAGKHITSLADLEGKVVAVGAEGSGHWVTAMNVLQLAGITPKEMLRLPPAESTAAVLQGKADAMFFVGGKPVRLFTNMQTLKNMNKPAYAQLLDAVRFVPLDDPRLLKEYSQSTLEAAEYGVAGGKVPTIAVTAVLMGYNFEDRVKDPKQKAARCQTIGRLGKALRGAFPELQKTGHPKWKEVTLQDSVAMWQKDSCIDAGTNTAAASKDSLENAVLDAMRGR